MEALDILRDWSDNCVHPTPWAVFLDLIGESEEIFGKCISPSMEAARKSLGYLELSYLAAALEEYATRPSDVRVYARELVESEMRP